MFTRSDFTVYDYAHSDNIVNGNIPRYKTRSSASSGRLQKAATNAWQTEVKQLRGKSVLLQLTSSTADTGDDVEADNEYDETLTDGDLMPVKPTSQQQRGSKKTSRRVDGRGGDGLVYPIDLWFLIGSYIAPEDVRTFACICHDTHVVAHSARFWLSLYRRFCRGCKSLPLSLQSTAVEHRPHGLRTRVIRALFHVYRPLSERLVSHSTSTISSSHTDPQRLTGLRCIMAWQERSSKPNWKFYFKFRRGSGRLGCPLLVSSSAGGGSGSSHSLLAPADVLYNPDERCVLLVVTTPHFLPLPLVMGQVLVKAAVTGSIFTQSLRLIFSSEYMQPSRSDVASSVIAHFDAFVSARIVNWWHPNYPHRHLK